MRLGLFVTAGFCAVLGMTSAFAAGLEDAVGAVTGGSVEDVATDAMTDAAASALTVENFDPEVVNGLIDKAPLEETQKATLKQGVQAAADNPEMLQTALDQVKSALGM
ncbi:MAG: hypothetical protein OIF40_09475 [Mangrovicoccus sp.]|nr:hypothetical protein [Mangrovicoccus sp.]